MMIVRESKISVTRQCELLGLCRSGLYYHAKPVSAADLALMRRIDELHLEHPFLGARRLAHMLQREGFEVGRRHVGTLMALMGIEAIYRRKQTSLPGKGHRIYPYLLRDVVIERSNQVWAADITYIPLAKGFAYLVAILDLYSRKVLAFRVANALPGPRTSASRPCKRLWPATVSPRSSTPTRAASSPTRISPRFSPTSAFASAWTAKGAGSIMYSSSGCGAA